LGKILLRSFLKPSSAGLAKRDIDASAPLRKKDLPFSPLAATA
jgi:hypothetical protein